MSSTADIMASTVDGAEVESTASSNATVKPEGDAASDQKPQDTSTSDEAESTSVVEAEKPDPTSEQLDRYKRRFKIWWVLSSRASLSWA